MSGKTIYASFVGINAYPQHALYGCIKDVLGMDFLLQELCSGQSDAGYKPLFFLAPHEGDKSSELFRAKGGDGFYEAPTFANITQKAFAHFKAAKNEDVCLFYYSGHGSQVPSPPEFWHTKPDKQSETLVCVDSRTTARDLVDKELAYLLWGALNGRDAHCLVIMDCCHSGNNTRALIEDDGLRFRHYPASNKSIPVTAYLGFDDPRNFYEVKGGKGSINIARYVHLAAARDDEKALETSGGLFTTKLLELLRSGATKSSYRSIAQTLNTTVRSRNSKQHPVLYAREEGDLDLPFLGGSLLAYQPSYEVRYDWGNERWVMYGGALHGITASAAGSRTIVEIKNTQAAVASVNAMQCLLDEQGLESLDKNAEDLRATVVQLATPPLVVGLSRAVQGDAPAVQQLKQSFAAGRRRFFVVDFEGKKDADYIIRQATDGCWMLTQRGGSVPLFRREKDAGSFMAGIDSVGKWILASTLKSENEAIGAADFDFHLERIEGRKIGRSNIEQLAGEQVAVQPGDEVLFQYLSGHQPAFRLSINLSSSSALQQCYIGVLYLESKFGINHTLIAQDANKLVKGGSPAKLGWQDGGRTYYTMPLVLDKKYALQGVSEVTSFLKVIISQKPFNLEGFAQPNLEPDEAGGEALRTIAFEEEAVAEDVAWQVFTFRLRLANHTKEACLQGGGEAAFAAFTIKAPAGFAATAFAATGDDVQAKISAMPHRGFGYQQAAVAAVLPPGSIWGDGVVEAPVFESGSSAFADNSVAVLELLPPADGQELVLAEGEPLVIAPKGADLKTRSAHDAEEAVVPYGYDPQAELYLPLGYSDDAGNIYVQQLPPPTPGRLQGPEALDRSLVGSVKLFFKKVLRQQKLNTLALWGVAQSGAWQQLTADPKAMQPLLQSAAGNKALLLIHGIIGDTADMCEAMRRIKPLPGNIPFLLTYDYENLATPVDKTAHSLKEDLVEAGFGNGAPELVILAHSMGGLVARWLIEQEGGAAFTSRLIMAGTPNGGSEMAKAILSVEGLITHALNAAGPVKYALTGLSFLAKKLGLNPLQALSGLAPGSTILQSLMEKGTERQVPYTLLCGDTTLLSEYAGDDAFLKKLAAHLMRKAVYPALDRFLYESEPNDLAVRIGSMKALPIKEGDEVRRLPCDHLTYFGLKEVEEALL